MLEGRSCRQARGLAELLYKLPAVERIEQVDIAWLAIQHLKGQLALLHKYPGWFLIRIAAIFQFKFIHCLQSPL